MLTLLTVRRGKEISLRMTQRTRPESPPTLYTEVLPAVCHSSSILTQIASHPPFFPRRTSDCSGFR